jgi:hypothetical protein
MIKTIKRILKEGYNSYLYGKLFKESKDNTLKKIIDKFGERFIELLFNKLDNMYEISVVWDDHRKPYDITIVNKVKKNEVSIVEPTTHIVNLIGDEENEKDFDDAIDIVTAWMDIK